MTKRLSKEDNKRIKDIVEALENQIESFSGDLPDDELWALAAKKFAEELKGVINELEVDAELFS